MPEPPVSRYGLSQVHAPADKAKVDIVFVHGLNGHPLDTWTSDEEKVFWPAQLLPPILEEEKARILVYGYDADTTSFTDGVSNDSIHNHAEQLIAALCANRRIRKLSDRPIIFVAHSLGGLVVKRALIYSSEIRGHNTENLRSIFVSTYGILFLGTPHLGADIAKWASRLERICSTMLPKKVLDSQPQLVQALKANSETLINIDRQFLQLILRYHVYFFHEGKPTDLWGTLRYIVDENSAAPNIPDVERSVINQDHIHMCKFEDERSPGFELVAEGIQRYAEEAPDTIIRRWIAEEQEKKQRKVQDIMEIFPQDFWEKSREPSDPVPAAPAGKKLPTITDDDIGLKVLRQTSDGSSQPVVDIVAVHGIGAHPDEAWHKSIDANRPEKGSVNWLKDKHMLPSVLPSARIMRYGYRLHGIEEKSIAEKVSIVAQRLLSSLKYVRKTCSNRPLIFIAHCFGGLVVLKAAVDAKKFSDKWPGLSQSIAGVIFFGTPFRDGATLTQEEMIHAAQVQHEDHQGHISTINPPVTIRENPADLVTVFLRTRERKDQFRIVCFFEQKVSYTSVVITGREVERYIIDEYSGCLDQSESVENYPLFRDHLNINKFGKPDEEDFLTVCDVVEEIVREALDPAKGLPATLSTKLQINRTGLQYSDYSVGWICASPTELAAAVAMLDERHDSLPQNPHDDISYSLGRIGNHNVVIACLPLGVGGTTSAARVASTISFTFPSIRFGLMVGVGSGAWSKRNDIRLGDVVVSKPSQNSGGVIQYDFGKTLQERRFLRTGSLRRPPDVLLHAVSTLDSKHIMGESELMKYVQELKTKYPKMQRTYTYQGTSNDSLFEPEHIHPTGEDTCLGCNPLRKVHRDSRNDTSPVVHYGLIASANQLMRDAVTREALQKDMDVLCFEMEAAGLMDSFPCLVIRGICDYADSHSNKQWQPYAAAVAAAYAKELLSVIHVSHIASTRTSAEAHSHHLYE